MNPLPTFLRRSLDNYRGRRGSEDDYLKYRSLELTYAITIKYVGTTFALIAADLSDEVKQEAWSAILSSSSLGGWLSAVESVCKRSESLPPDVRNFCDHYSASKRHPEKERLTRISARMNAIIDQLNELGYEIQTVKSPNIRRLLEVAVQIRNKCAHGVLEPPFFASIEAPLFSSLRETLSLIPFGKFVFWGRYGSKAFQFVEVPSLKRRNRDLFFWVESDLLRKGFTDDIPFLSYLEGTQAIYFINDVPKDGTAEFIDYQTGQIRHYDVPFDLEKTHAKAESRAMRPREYRSCMDVITDIEHTWRRIVFSQNGVDATTDDEVGVYVFSANVKLQAEKRIEVVLYVGRTTSLHTRLKHYLRVQKGFITSRPELSYMFETYGEDIRLFFVALPADKIAGVERAIYELTMPEYNLVTPSD